MTKRQKAATVALYRAVGRWAKAHDGGVLVAGGVEVQQSPSDWPYQFRVAVKCTGKIPTKPDKESGR